METLSEEQTVAAGNKLGQHLSGLVLLLGGLGAGKTTLVRGIVAAIPGTLAMEVSSPTFTLIHDYGAGVFHVDLYRLEEPREIEALGLREILDEAKLVLVEWPERLGTAWPLPRTEIQLERVDDQHRRIAITKLTG